MTDHTRGMRRGKRPRVTLTVHVQRSVIHGFFRDLPWTVLLPKVYEVGAEAEEIKKKPLGSVITTRGLADVLVSSVCKSVLDMATRRSGMIGYLVQFADSIACFLDRP